MSKTKEPIAAGNPTNANPSAAPNPGSIEHRLVVPIQTRGNLGKSTEAIARGEWMSARGVQWNGYDLDVSNRTLSTALPAQVTFVPMSAEPEGHIVRILRAVTRNEVTLIDPSAHMDQTILRAFRMVRFPEMAAAAQARATVMIYPLDEISDMDDIARTVEALGPSVDWVVVRNLARIPTTKFFDRSPLDRLLQQYGAARLDLPPLLTDTRNYLRTREARLGRAFSPGQAINDPALEIDLGHQLILEEWIDDLFTRFDAIASHLLPTAIADRIPAPPAPATAATGPANRRGSSINLENDDEH